MHEGFIRWLNVKKCKYNKQQTSTTTFKPPSPFLFSTHLLSHSHSGGLHGLNMLTGKLNRYILYKSPQTQKPQVAVFINPELSSSSSH